MTWFQRGYAVCRSLHIIVFDWRTRFARFKTAIQLPAGRYSAQACLGEWCGHGPAYVALWNKLHQTGIPSVVAELLDVFKESVALQNLLPHRYEVVVASPGWYSSFRVSRLLSCGFVFFEYI